MNETEKDWKQKKKKKSVDEQKAVKVSTTI